MAGTLGTVIQIVGTVVGAYFNAPYLGSLLGGLIGGAVDPTVSEGPKLGDLNVRASTYGKNIPIIYGRENRVGGNIIWSRKIREQENKDRDFLGGTESITYTYSASFALALGQGTMRNIEAIYANGKKLWTRQGTIDNLFGHANSQGEKAALCADPGSNIFERATCVQFQDSLDYLLSRDSDSEEMPDFTPWILSHHVALSSEGYGVLPTDDNRRATFFSGGEFEQLEWFPGTDDQPVSTIIPAPTPAYRGTAYLVFKNLQLGRFGNQIPTIEVVVSGLRGDTVADVIADICERAGASLDEAVPRGALAQFPVRGYAIGNARNAFSAIAPLMRVYPFDACDHAGTVRFTPRRRSPYATIMQEEMGARQSNDDRQPVFPIERIPNYELPSEASVSYVDPSNGYQAGTQVATRVEGNSQSKLNESLPLTMSPDEARSIAERMLWEGWLSREQVKPVRVSEKYDWLQPGDVFAVPVPGDSYTAYRILDTERGDNGIIEWSVMREDRLAYDGNLPGGEPFTFEQDEPFYGPTIAALFNAPMLNSGDDDTGFPFALDSESAQWSNATLYRSIDETETWQQAAKTSQRDSISRAVSMLPAGPTDIWDRINVLTLELLFPHDPPQTVTEAALLADPLLNLLWLGAPDGSDGELIQFATVTQTSDDQYELSDLLRGRRATEHYVGLHAADDLAVLIPQKFLNSLDYGQNDWNLERFYMPISVGQQMDTGLPFIFVATGERLRPRSPVHVAGSRDGSSNLSLTWIRRNRMFPPPMGYGAVPLGEASEAYEVDILSGVTVVRTISVTSQAATYSAANQTTDGFTPGDPISGNVYQISATRGRGHPAAFTV